MARFQTTVDHVSDEMDRDTLQPPTGISGFELHTVEKAVQPALQLWSNDFRVKATAGSLARKTAAGRSHGRR